MSKMSSTITEVICSYFSLLLGELQVNNIVEIVSDDNHNFVEEGLI